MVLNSNKSSRNIQKEQALDQVKIWNHALPSLFELIVSVVYCYLDFLLFCQMLRLYLP